MTIKKDLEKIENYGLKECFFRLLFPSYYKELKELKLYCRRVVIKYRDLPNAELHQSELWKCLEDDRGVWVEGEELRERAFSRGSYMAQEGRWNYKTE